MLRSKKVYKTENSNSSVSQKELVKKKFQIRIKKQLNEEIENRMKFLLPPSNNSLLSPNIKDFKKISIQLNSNSLSSSELHLQVSTSEDDLWESINNSSSSSDTESNYKFIAKPESFEDHINDFDLRTLENSNLEEKLPKIFNDSIDRTIEKNSDDPFTWEISANDDEYCLIKRKQHLAKKIEGLMKSLNQKYEATGNVKLSIKNTYKWDNLEFSEQMLSIRGDSATKNVSTNDGRTVTRFTRIVFLLNEILQRLVAGIKCTIRELYYHNPELFQDHTYVKHSLHDICCLLRCTPWELGVLTSSKGIIAGSLLISFPDDAIIDCKLFETIGFSIPNDISEMKIIDSNAEFVLLVEKETIFEKFIQLKIFKRIRREFILITGKGYPDINTRLILRKILNKFEIPVFALVDADPFGIEIMLTYKFGSKELSFMSHCLACPEIKWIGVLPSEIELLSIPSFALNREDEMRIYDLLKRNYISCDVRAELNLLQALHRKSEIEGISSFSFNFLIDNYILNKIDHKK